jgi:hypothetical protein
LQSDDLTVIAVMPIRAIEIHDSILEAVSFSHGEAQLYFSSVYIHQSEGVSLRDAGSGWVQKAIIRIHDAEVKGAFSEFPVDLRRVSTTLRHIPWEFIECCFLSLAVC